MTDQQRDLILASALYDKIKKLEWLNRGKPFNSDHVKLTDEEAAKAIERAEKLDETKRYFEEMAKANRERERQAQDAELSKWTASHFYRVMVSRAADMGIRLLYDDQTAAIIKTMCFRLSGDNRYETELGLSPRRGLLLRGTPGLGKTFIPSLVADNPLNPVQIVSLNEITETIRKTGEYTGLKFGTYKIIYLDDLGTEETPVKYYGTEITWFKTWYENFYSTAKSHTNRLIISTNLSFQQIEDKYGFRIRDRMAETFNVLDLSGESLRRKIA
jgi:DNA replication protein DnaC